MTIGRTAHGSRSGSADAVLPRPVNRTAPSDSVNDLLSKAVVAPSALLVSGETGIGKSTLWLAGVAQAAERGFQVLSARAARGESVLAHAALADLLGGIESSLWSHLPRPQRRALDAILLRDNASGVDHDLRAAATAVLNVVQRLADTAPVLLAIDDLHWVDAASADILHFVTRRLSGPVGVLATATTDAGSPRPAARLHLPRASDVDRIILPPITIGALQVMLSKRLGRSLSRPDLVRVHDVSGGNPYYALELALALDTATASERGTLPGTLIDVVRTRVGDLRADVQQALLVAAALTAPTVELVARALDGSPDEVLGLLECAEEAGIVRIDGHQLRFTHPLLASGIYAGATPARRRRVHRSLADGLDDLELRARHLALGSAAADPRIVALLDSAAQAARRRGSPTSAAELLDLAVDLGGDTPVRRTHSAAAHFAAGDAPRARMLLEQSAARLTPGPERTSTLGVLAGVHLFDDSVTTAAELLQQGLAESEPSVDRVQMLIAQGFARLTAGDPGAAIDSADSAVAEAAGLGNPVLRGQALGLRRVATFHQGRGLDEPWAPPVLDEADDVTPMPLRPRMNDALLQAWSGQLDLAHDEITRLRTLSQRRGDEYDQLYVGYHGALIELWRSDFAAAAVLGTETMERAEQLGGDVPLAMAAIIEATVHAYAGRISEARRAGRTALQASRRCGARCLSRSALTALTFLESSRGDHAAVASLVEPLLEADAGIPRASEIVTAAYLPDAAEALITLGRFGAAEVLVDRLERNGRRLDRAWMLAVGGRCRALLSAAVGDVDTATAAVERAMAQHQRMSMPFEEARTQLVMGQLQRRQRRKDDAAGALTTALATFEALDTPLWADRARAELARSNTGPRRAGGLTPSEWAVAELAASGMTNRDVAANLFISPKTVEANLMRVYRKLDIHSRAELGRQMSQFDEIRDGAPVA